MRGSARQPAGCLPLRALTSTAGGQITTGLQVKQQNSQPSYMLCLGCVWGSESSHPPGPECYQLSLVPSLPSLSFSILASLLSSVYFPAALFLPVSVFVLLFCLFSFSLSRSACFYLSQLILSLFASLSLLASLLLLFVSACWFLCLSSLSVSLYLCFSPSVSLPVSVPISCLCVCAYPLLTTSVFSLSPFPLPSPSPASRKRAEITG